MLADGNFALGIAIGGVSALLALLGIDFFELPIGAEATSAILGAVIGATIAFGGSVLTVADARRERNEARKFNEAALTHGLVTKLVDLNDGLQKWKRHFMIYDISTKVFFGDDSVKHSFSKPLEGMSQHIYFNIEERTYLLQAKGAEYFNTISDMKGISENFSFLRDQHKEAYYALMEEIADKNKAREGYKMSGEINRDSQRLMAMMDIDGALRSLVDGSAEEVGDFLKTMIEFSNKTTEVSIGYQMVDTPPSAENDKRQDY